MCVRACVYACVSACLSVCVCVCVCVCVVDVSLSLVPVDGERRVSLSSQRIPLLLECGHFLFPMFTEDISLTIIRSTMPSV